MNLLYFQSGPSDFFDECIQAMTQTSIDEPQPGYVYSHSSSSSYTPETGTVGHSATQFRDESGRSKREMSRILDGTVVTETWETDETGKEHLTKRVEKQPAGVQQLSEFDDEWQRRSEEVHSDPTIYLYVNMMPASLTDSSQAIEDDKAAEQETQEERNVAAGRSGEQKEETQIPNVPFHEGVFCDGCKMQGIKGDRYMSSTHDNFDLCTACENSGKFDAEHGPFLKIKTPSQVEGVEIFRK